MNKELLNHIGNEARELERHKNGMRRDKEKNLI